MEKFSYETNGYNRSEVNQFVSDVIKETEGIITRVRKQNKEIEELRKELKHYKTIESTSKNTIMKAENESNTIIENAKNNASRIVNEALLKAEKIEIDADLVERNMGIFKSKLKTFMNQQKIIMDEIEVLELEEPK